MELLDRYLQAVRKHLNWKRQDDIVAELRANLESQLEDKESELGRALTPAEAEAWVKSLGSPMQMAARYQPQQYLIGPSLFPVYWYVLRMAIGWTVAIYALVSAILIATGDPNIDSVLAAAFRAPGVLITVAAWVTFTFAAFELVAARGMIKLSSVVGSPCDWEPATLPKVDPAPASGKKRRTYAQAVTEAIFGFIFLIYLLLIPEHPSLMLGPGALYLKSSPYYLAPVWMQAFWWIIGLNILQLGWKCVDLVRGTWNGPRTLGRFAEKGIGLIPLVLLLTVPNHALVLLKPDRMGQGLSLDSIDLGITRALLIIFAIAALQLIWDIGKFAVDAYRKREARR